ncbi:uncharacterized protein LOC133172933 [Saccostrea echinata]|uniref:uncharacterized protein LOC133172933 n=1 Tax=Saccostrea echinata TaxID=191078 RepID=UPI002A836077|nr:uncharacterized protein LOC133172933 [Saccostrea echinata]
MIRFPVIIVCLMLPQYLVSLQGPGSRVYHFMKQRQKLQKCPCKRSLPEVEAEIPVFGRRDNQHVLWRTTIPQRKVKIGHTLGRILKSGFTLDDGRKTKNRLKK